MLDLLLTFENQASLQSACTKHFKNLFMLVLKIMPMIHLMVGFKSLDKITICLNNFITLPYHGIKLEYCLLLVK